MKGKKIKKQTKMRYGKAVAHSFLLNISFAKSQIKAIKNRKN